jgi:hypothetical protein
MGMEGKEEGMVMAVPGAVMVASVVGITTLGMEGRVALADGVGIAETNTELGATLEATGAALEATGAALEATGAALEVTGAALEATGTALEATGAALEATGAVPEPSHVAMGPPGAV